MKIIKTNGVLRNEILFWKSAEHRDITNINTHESINTVRQRNLRRRWDSLRAWPPASHRRRFPRRTHANHACVGWCWCARCCTTSGDKICIIRAGVNKEEKPNKNQKKGKCTSVRGFLRLRFRYQTKFSFWRTKDSTYSTAQYSTN